MLDKEKALEIALAQIEKQFGKGAIIKLGDSSANLNISAIPTGCIDLDIALGVGGIPRGRIVEIFGPESSGKTTIALHVGAQAQTMGRTAAFIDAEHALDPVYAESLGVNVDDLYVSLASKDGVQVKELHLTGERSRIRRLAVLHALDLLRRKLTAK